MNDGVRLPNNIENQHFDFLKKMCGNATDKFLSDKFISIQFFRELYVKDIHLFSIFVKELSLRGGTFQLTSPSPLFPNNKIKNENLIIEVPDNLDVLSYKKIDFTKIKMKQQMDQFNIQGNSFYHGIPFEGFKNLNLTDVDLDFLKKEFEDIGFLIKENLDNKKSNMEEMMVDEIKDKKLKEELSVYENSNFLINISSVTSVFTKELSERLSKSLINQVVELTYPKGIKLVNEMNIQEINQIINQLKKFYSKKEVMAEYGDQLLREYLTEENNCILLSMFKENKWNMTNNAISKLGIETLKDLNYSTLLSIFKSRNVGVNKVIGFLDRLFLYFTDGYAVKSIIIEENEKQVQQKYFSLGLITVGRLNKSFAEESRYYISYAELMKEINGLEIKSKERKILLAEAEKQIENNKTKVDISSTLLNRSTDLILKDLIDIFNLKFDDVFIQTKEYQMFQEKLEYPVHLIYQEIFELTHFYEHIVNYYYTQLSKLMNVENKIEEALEDEKKRVIFVNRIQNNCTLEETGELLGITRERVRQLEKQQRLSFLNLLNNNGIELFLYTLRKEGLINFSTFENDAVISVLEMIQDNFGYQVNKGFRIIVAQKESNLLSTLQEFVNNIVNRKNYISKEKIALRLKKIENKKLLEFIMSNKEVLLENNNLTEYNNIVISKRIGKSEFAVVILAIFFDNKTIDAGNYNDVEQFYQYYAPIFPDASLDFENLSRSIIGFFDRQQEKVIKIDSNTYKILDIESLETELIDDVASFVRNELVNDEVIYLKRIYREFEKLLEKNNMTQFEIYYYLRLFYAEEFDFGAGNTMRIFQKGIEKRSTEEIIYNKLLDFGGSVGVNEIADYLGVERYTIEQAAHISEKMTIKNATLETLDVLTKNISQGLLDFLVDKCEELLMKDGYVVSKLLFEELLFDNNFSDLLSKSNINSSDKLLQILKRIIPNVRGHSKFIYYAKKKIDTIDIYLDYMGEEEKFHREDLYKVGEQLGYSIVTSNMLIIESIDNGRLIPIDEIYLMRSELFIIDDQSLELVDQYIQENMYEPGYLSCIQQKGLRRKLPLLTNLHWSPQLLFYVATKLLSYKKADIKGVSYNVNPHIILEKNSILNYNKLVVYHLKRFEGSNHEERIGEFLYSKGLIATKNKQIPSHLFVEEVLEKDEIGFVTLLQ
ncbi:sigma factor-like helix-turn-helix DNA-binding protein [Vagococcus fluvialis]|uniref:sigma factor-like helix-turn-helix DNA-binding protein n=1 Tax=Vagococcus fluvialis TaxID=2738 RepID=UPI003B225E0D